MLNKYFTNSFLGILLIVIIFGLFRYGTSFVALLDNVITENQAAVAAVVRSPFHYSFSVAGTLHEVGNMDLSSSPYFWLNSGGQFILKSGIGMTMQGEASALNRWRVLYGKSNPVDTDGGLHPQNILRLITRSKWADFSQQAYFRIRQNQLSQSPNRNESNGLLLMSRYKDGANLYYAGLRVDGNAIIKKKINGKYYTLASRSFLTGAKYNRDTNPNLLPLNSWIGIRSEVKTLVDGKVSIKLYVDNGKTGNWTLVTQVIDDDKSYGGEVILDEQYAGIRTDFMDVEVDDYWLERI